MPIIEKIEIARDKYAKKLTELQACAASKSAEPDFEKNMIDMLIEMQKLKTEADILEKVNAHRAQS